MASTPPTTGTPLIGLTIAGHDPSSGAGVTADMQVFAAHGIFATSCITSLTAQSTLGVKSTATADPVFLAECLRHLIADTPPDGVKIGMLGDARIVATVATFLGELDPRIPVVLDPVLISTSGRPLLSDDGVNALIEQLLPRVSWITPNRSELGRLVGRDCSRAEQVESALRDPSLRGKGVVVTGGDSLPPSDCVALPTGEFEWITGEHIVTSATHGTGCAFSTAFLSGLMRGRPTLDAARAAKRYVEEAMWRAPRIGGGRGPMNLLWPLDLRFAKKTFE